MRDSVSALLWARVEMVKNRKGLSRPRSQVKASCCRVLLLLLFVLKKKKKSTKNVGPLVLAFLKVIFIHLFLEKTGISRSSNELVDGV